MGKTDRRTDGQTDRRTPDRGITLTAWCGQCDDVKCFVSASFTDESVIATSDGCGAPVTRQISSRISDVTGLDMNTAEPLQVRLRCEWFSERYRCAVSCRLFSVGRWWLQSLRQRTQRAVVSRWRWYCSRATRFLFLFFTYFSFLGRALDLTSPVNILFLTFIHEVLSLCEMFCRCSITGSVVITTCITTPWWDCWSSKYFRGRGNKPLVHIDSIEFICAMQKNSYVCMYVTRCSDNSENWRGGFDSYMPNFTLIGAGVTYGTPKLNFTKFGNINVP